MNKGFLQGSFPVIHEDPQKVFQKLIRRKRVAMGEEKADMVIKNARVFNVATGQFVEPTEGQSTDIAIVDGVIAGIFNEYNDADTFVDARGLTAVPGFFDCHVHPESTHIPPQSYDQVVTTRGTTTVIADPHEIANVLGTQGIEYFLENAENMVMDMVVQLSSCVPASALGSSGHRLLAADLLQFKDHPYAGSLAEMMDLGGFFGEDDGVFDKLAAFSGQTIDGHIPGIRDGYMINALRGCGVCNDHESTTLEEAAEKLQRGVQVFIREGTVCNDAAKLAQLINRDNWQQFGFCTDDRSLPNIHEDGHIDHVIRTVLKQGADIPSVYRIASYAPAIGFNLRDRGALFAGHKADITLLSDVENCAVASVIKDGQSVNEARFESRKPVPAVGLNSIKIARDVTADDFAMDKNDLPEGYQDNGTTVSTSVIGINDGDIVSENRTIDVAVNGQNQINIDTDQDILKIAVIERHGKNGYRGIDLVQGFGIKEGALACSIGHDDHNITVVGASEEDMAVAVNHLKEIQGGAVVVKNGQVIDSLPYEIAGLIMNTDGPLEDTIALKKRFDDNVLNALSPHMDAPFMKLYFLSLEVIPTRKVTHRGPAVFEPEKGDLGPRLLRQQSHKIEALTP